MRIRQAYDHHLSRTVHAFAARAAPMLQLR